MFKFLKRFFLLLLAFGLTLFTAGTLVGFYYIDDLALKLTGSGNSASTGSGNSKPNESEPSDDEPEKPKTAGDQVALLDYYDEINELKDAQPLKPLCEIICERSHFYGLQNENIFQFIKNFFEREKEKAFDDAGFRLALLRVNLMTDLFPKPIRELILDVEKIGSMTSLEKLLFVARAELSIAKFIYHVKSRQKENFRLSGQLDQIIKLQRQCSSKNRGATENVCRGLNEANW